VGSKTFEGVWFISFSDDHLPPHVHGKYAGTMVIVDLLADGGAAESTRSKAINPANAKRSDVRKIVNTAKQHGAELRRLWEKTHGRANY
jgi:hypothetical protein